LDDSPRELHLAVIQRDPIIPGPYAFAATALSGLGRIQEADALLKEGSDRWPANPFIWNAKFNHLVFSGRPASAVALALDPEARPSRMTDEDVKPYMIVARAAESGARKDVDAAVSVALGLARVDARNIVDAAPIFGLFGRLDVAFDALQRYFLDRGPFGRAAPIGPYTRRYTDTLFSPPMAAARRDARYQDLTRAIGLDDYWRRLQGSLPRLPV
jgi:hypothetical protein